MAKTRMKVPAIGHNLVPQSREAAIAQICRIGELDRELKRRELDLNDALAKIKKAVEEAKVPIEQERDELTTGLQTWCDAHRAELTENGRVKHADLGTGKVRWQDKRNEVKGVPKKADGLAKLIAAIKERGLVQFIRTKEEVDKEAMQAEPELAETLKGIKVRGEGEEFVVEPFHAELSGVAA